MVDTQTRFDIEMLVRLMMIDVINFTDKLALKMSLVDVYLNIIQFQMMLTEIRKKYYKSKCDLLASLESIPVQNLRTSLKTHINV